MKEPAKTSIADNEKKTGKHYIAVKRIIDLFLAITGIILLFPVFIIISVLIKLDSKGPIFFTQIRVGLNGKEFKMYKFRSMIADAEKLKKFLLDKNEMDGPMFKIKEDPRITKVGRIIRRTSIDELPQLFNIVRGEMSLVGPRPSLPSEVELFEPWMKERLKVKPGLTCYWQVCGRNSIGFIEWMKMDIEYVNNMNLKTDIYLIMKTIHLLLGDKHAR